MGAKIKSNSIRFTWTHTSPSHAGSWYLVTSTIDNLYIEVNFLNTKDNIKNAFIKYKAVDENLSGKEIKIFLTDNDLECCSKEFNKYL